MPVSPIIENPYRLPPLSGASTEGDRRFDPAQPIEDVRLEMMRSIAANAQRPGADQEALGRALSAASRAVPMSEWKPEPERLPVSRREALRSVLESRERQLRILEQFAADPKNPVAQEEVERIRSQIESESQRALANGTLPSPVSMYETLVEQDAPEVIQAKTKENLSTIPGFKQGWSAFVTFDENNQPVYPKWMEKPMESAMAKAMGVAEEKEDPALEAALKFQEDELKRQKPDQAQYGQGKADPAYVADLKAWEGRMRAFFVRSNPEAARLLPTFAEEQGFTTPTSPTAEPGLAPSPVSPVVNQEEIEQLRVRLAVDGINPAVAESADKLREQIAAGEVSPGDAVIVSTPSGAIALRMTSDGKFQQFGRFTSRQ